MWKYDAIILVANLNMPINGCTDFVILGHILQVLFKGRHLYDVTIRSGIASPKMININNAACQVDSNVFSLLFWIASRQAILAPLKSDSPT